MLCNVLSYSTGPVAGPQKRQGAHRPGDRYFAGRQHDADRRNRNHSGTGEIFDRPGRVVKRHAGPGRQSRCDKSRRTARVREALEEAQVIDFWPYSWAPVAFGLPRRQPGAPPVPSAWCAQGNRCRSFGYQVVVSAGSTTGLTRSPLPGRVSRPRKSPARQRLGYNYVSGRSIETSAFLP